MELPRLIIDAVLFCPHCGSRHIDEVRNEHRWERVELARRNLLKDAAWKIVDRFLENPGKYDPPAVDGHGFFESSAAIIREIVEEAVSQAVLSMQKHIDNGPSYPTPDAYEAVCAARTKWQERAEKAEAHVTALRTALEEVKVVFAMAAAHPILDHGEQKYLILAAAINDTWSTVNAALSATPPADKFADYKMRARSQIEQGVSVENTELDSSLLDPNPPPAVPDTPRRSGHSKLVYDKTKRTIVTEGAAPVTTLFQDGEFTAASGQTLPFKIECDALTDADWEWAARYVVSRTKFSLVEGVFQGGFKFADALESYNDSGETGSLLIVDDVLTTGESMERQRNGRTAKGVVLFARGPCPDWVTPIWTLAAPDTTAIVEAARELLKAFRFVPSAECRSPGPGNRLVDLFAAHDKANSANASGRPEVDG